MADGGEGSVTPDDAGFPISGIEAEEWDEDKLEASEDDEANTNEWVWSSLELLVLAGTIF